MSTRTILAVTVALSVGAMASTAQTKQLLTQAFEARPVSQVEIGDFHFLPGQVAPTHTHVAPVFGYVSRGSIYYQVEGQKPVILKAGDAFYEPVGLNILHFDNASKTEEAVFTDLNFERAGEPFIVFPTPPTERIDRRTFPSERREIASANTMNVTEDSVSPAGVAARLKPDEAVYVYVAEGSVSVKVRGEAAIIYPAGQTFFHPRNASDSQVANASTTVPARLISFHLSKSAPIK